MRRSLQLALALALTATLFATEAGAQQVIHVFPGQSIQAAVDAAEPGDTIIVHAGVYRESVEVTTDRLTIRGEGASRNGTVLAPPREPPDNLCAAFEFVSGFCVHGQVDPETFQFGDPVVRTVIRDFLIWNFPGSGILTLNAQGPRYARNVLRGHGEYGLFSLFTSDGIYRRNSAIENGFAGFYIGDSQPANSVLARNVARANALGAFIRDASGGAIRGNVFRGNCTGILFLDVEAPGPVADWTATNNVASRNNQFCPGEDEEPALSGAGIALGGTRRVTVEDNVANRNRPSGDAPFAGGIVLFSTAEFGGSDPIRNLIVANEAHGNRPADIVWDGSGRGNRFLRNDCERSIPPGLCDR